MLILRVCLHNVKTTEFSRQSGRKKEFKPAVWLMFRQRLLKVIVSRDETYAFIICFPRFKNTLSTLLGSFFFNNI